MSVAAAILLGVGLIGYAMVFIVPSTPRVPKLDDVYWGPGERPAKAGVRPFKVKFSEENENRSISTEEFEEVRSEGVNQEEKVFIKYEIVEFPNSCTQELNTAQETNERENNVLCQENSLALCSTDNMVADLRLRLNNTRELQPSLENVAWTYGVNSNYVPTIVEYWLNMYNFKKREEHLNRYPQFLTNIQGLDIHFIHVKPQLPNDRELQVLPLLILHGWPGSVVEFQKIIPLLTTPRPDRDFVFELVVPSLPGFGFSSAAAKPGLGSLGIAHMMKNLMLTLGYEKFYTQGGDWGANIIANMAVLYPEHILGMHSNFCMVINLWTLIKMPVYNWMPSLLVEQERGLMRPISQILSQFIEEGGYFHIQATKPDTIGVSMSDSPAGLAAYLLEKFSLGTRITNKFRNDGGLLDKFTMDELIDNIMLYWAPNKSTTAFRIYAESVSSVNWKRRLEHIPITVPSACAQFPEEILFQPADLLRNRFINLVRTRIMPRGGHFAAMEEPELLADEIFAAIQIMHDDKINKEKERKK